MRDDQHGRNLRDAEEAGKIIAELLQDLAVNLERIENAREVIKKNGCDCECDHHWEDHDEDCERCLACRIEHALVGKPLQEAP